MIKIVVDLLGADKPQTELVLGAIRAISENKDLYVYLMGRKAELEDFLANVTYDESQLEIVDCTQEITNYDDPVDAYHDKTDSSLIKGLKMCRMNEDIGGFVTCGATGVVLISSILILGKLNATRPALSVVLNGRNDKPFCIVDCGANPYMSLACKTALAVLLYATIMWAGKSVIFKESIRYILKRESK